MKFGDNLKEIRKTRKISQEELADRLGVSRQSVSKWETGENYPTMQNIICLCDIFKCKMNDLVHEDFEDLEFMDEEVKMSVVKLNEREQNHIKAVSKILYLIGRISKIVVRVAIAFVVLAMIVTPIFVKEVEFKDNKFISSGQVLKVEELNDGLRVSFSKNEHIIISDLKNENFEMFRKAFNKYSKGTIILLLEIGFIILIAFLITLSILLDRLDKLFFNIYSGDTPFTLDNVRYIKQMSYLMIACIILSSIGGTVFNISFANEEIIDLELFDIVEIIFLYALSLIFEYGARIQQDSKGKMYGNE